MKWKGSLDNDSIGKAVAQAEKEAEKAGIEGEQRLRFTLSLEETLLICKEQCGQSAFFSLTDIIPKEEAIALMKEAARDHMKVIKQL